MKNLTKALVMADEPLSTDELRALRVVDLKEKLTTLGLSTAGNLKNRKLLNLPSILGCLVTAYHLMVRSH